MNKTIGHKQLLEVYNGISPDELNGFLKRYNLTPEVNSLGRIRSSKFSPRTVKLIKEADNFILVPVIKVSVLSLCNAVDVELDFQDKGSLIQRTPFTHEGLHGWYLVDLNPKPYSSVEQLQLENDSDTSFRVILFTSLLMKYLSLEIPFLKVDGVDFCCTARIRTSHSGNVIVSDLSEEPSQTLSVMKF